MAETRTPESGAAARDPRDEHASADLVVRSEPSPGFPNYGLSLDELPDDRPPLHPSRIFEGKRLVVVGGTGFLGKVWLSMLLDRFPRVGKVFLLVRPKQGRTAEERFWADIAPSPAFDPLREAHPGPAFEAFVRDKITAVSGDIARPRLGFDDALLAELGHIDAVVNVAGVVDFNPPLDEALEVNAFGVNNLIDLARALRPGSGVPVMHTSTCYVAGYRTGPIVEVDPLQVPFPRAEGTEQARLIAPPEGIPVDRRLDRRHWDPQREIDECMDVITAARHRCEDAFRQSAFLDEAKRNLERRGEPCRGSVLDEELATVKRSFTRERLADAGLERARYWGWPNIYTYTKSIGEQVLAASGLPYTIVRPAVIESSDTFPFCGWNEGINTSAPFIYMAFKGQSQFPADPNVHLDLIPVDMVTAGMLASLAELLEGTHRPVYQYGCTDTNPCKVGRYMELIGLYKRKKLQDGGDEGNAVINAILARIEPVKLTKKEYERHGAHAIAKAARGVSSWLDRVGVGPMRALLKPTADVLRRAADREDKIGDVMDLFLPFVAECDWVFSCKNTRDAMERMPPEERALFYWEPEKIDWREWMNHVHLPAIERWAVPEVDARQRRELKPRRRYDTLLDLLDEMAERHGHAVALRMLTDEGLTRITFHEWREMSAACGARLALAGVQAGDRVLLSGDNRPAWPIAYFGILRAGAVAVPVDPKLPADQIANVVTASGAKVALLGEEVAERAGELLASTRPELTVLDLDAVTEDDRALPVSERRVAPHDLASIIYTSGTTGAPKGVMLTHDNFTSLLAAITPLFVLGPRDSVLSVLPLHHTFEFSCGLLLPMASGTPIAYLGELTSERLGEGIRKSRVSAMVGVPALWQMLERRVRAEVAERGPAQKMAFDWGLELNRMLGKRLGVDAGRLFFGSVHDKLGGRVRYLISGGSALPKGTADMFKGLGLALSEGYGLTEAAPVLTVAKASPRGRTGHVGKAVPGVEIRIDRPDDSGVGEVLARGRNVMHGYFGNDEATRASIDADGWLHTGDLGKLDARGQLVLSGRSKDVIVTTSGENVYPDDVEDMLAGVQHIEELSIVGMSDAQGAERVACLAVPQADDSLPASELRARALRSLKEALAKLPRHCQPSIVHMYDADLPKTATRKVKRSEVRDILERLLAASTRLPAHVAGTDGELAVVQHAVAAIAGRPVAEVLATTSLSADLGFDSLMAMELNVALEAQLGRGLDAETMSRVETVADLARALGANRGRSLARAVEATEEEPVVLPAPVAFAAKQALTSMQHGFYDRVMKPTVYGRAFLPHNRNTIVVSNHASHLDMGFVKYALGSYGTDIVGLAAQDYFFKGRWRRAYFDQLTNLQAFDRKTNLRQALREAGDTIRAGRNVLIFPEGTRSTDGLVHEFAATLGHLALETRVDILPVYVGGTYESWPKGRRVPTRRDIEARIGLPLKIADLERLTEGMRFTRAARAVSAIARQAVVVLSRRGVLDLSTCTDLDDALGEKKEHPLVTLFRELEGKYVAGKVSKPITFYFSLGAEDEAKWTMRLAPDACAIEPGKPSGSADCVLKTSADMFTKMVREQYQPTPMEIMSGQIKSNDVSLLATFQEAFDLR